MSTMEYPSGICVSRMRSSGRGEVFKKIVAKVEDQFGASKLNITLLDLKISTSSKFTTFRSYINQIGA